MTKLRSGWFALVAGAILSMGAFAACAEEDEPVIQDEAAEEDDGTATDDQATIEDEEIFEHTKDFIDQQVTVEGEVVEMVSENLFRLEGPSGADSSLLVAYAGEDEGQTVDDGARVQVTGFVRSEDDPAEVGEELGVEVDFEASELADQYVIVASSVEDAGAV